MSTRARESRARLGAAVALATAISTPWAAAQGQEAPEIRRLEVVIPYSAGGGTDLLSRALIEELKGVVDATIAVRNVPGDAAMLGLSRVARAASDEPMLAFHNPPNTVLAQLARGDEAVVDIRELTPIAGYAKTYSVVATYAESDYETYEDLVAAYESGEERLFGGTDRGGSSELAAILIKEQWGVPWEEYVAYDGSGDHNAALARQEIPAGLGSFDSVFDGMQSGALHPLVVLGAHERQKGMPDTPTAVELGLTSLEEIAAPTRIIVGPPDMDPALRDYLVSAWEQVLTDPEVIEKFAQDRVEIIYMPPDEVGALIDRSFEALEELPALKALSAGN